MFFLLELTLIKSPCQISGKGFLLILNIANVIFKVLQEILF